MRRKKHSVLLARVDEQASPAEVWDMIRVDVSTFKEDGQVVAVCEPLEGNLAGVGETREEALDDFIEGLKALVDFHKFKGQFPQFMVRHFGEGPVKVMMPVGSTGGTSMVDPEYHCHAWRPEVPETNHEAA